MDSPISDGVGKPSTTQDTNDLTIVSWTSRWEAGTRSVEPFRFNGCDSGVNSDTRSTNGTMSPEQNDAVEKDIDTSYKSTFDFWVGPKWETFHVYQEYLSAVCPIAKAEQTNGANSTFQKELKHGFSAIEPRIFNHFLHWLYHDTFTTSNEAHLVSYCELVELYYIGEEFQAVLLKNAVLDCMVRESVLHTKPLPIRLIDRVYAITQPASPLRRLWVDLYVWTVSFDELEQHLDSGTLPQNFSQDLIRILFRNSRASTSAEPAVPPFLDDISSYHEADVLTGDCCVRPQFHGGGENHHAHIEDGVEALKAKLSRAEAKIQSLRSRGEAMLEELDMGSPPRPPAAGKKRKLFHEQATE